MLHVSRVGIWAGPRPYGLLRAGVRLSRGPLRCRAAHRSRWSRPYHPSRILQMLQLRSETAAQRSGPPHFAPYANAAHRSSLLASLFTRLAMAPVAAFGQPTLPQTPLRPPGTTPLRRLRPAPPTSLHSPGSLTAPIRQLPALPPAAQPTHQPPGAPGHSAQKLLIQPHVPAHAAARFPMVSQPPKC